MIVDIKVMGNRVYVSDVQEGIQFVKYKAQENQLTLYADETMPRYIIGYSSHQCVIIIIVVIIRFVTAACVLDYSTVASADKFGNIALVRLVNQTRILQ